MKAKTFDNIEAALRDIKQGKFIILVLLGFPWVG